MRTPRALRFGLAAALFVGVVGCTEKEGVKKETTVTTPEGTKKITQEDKVETSHKNPPADNTPRTTTSTTTTEPRNP
jgi:hypothetical protein